MGAPAASLVVLSVASEVFPLIKTGGLADVAGALPGALVSSGVAMRTLLPGYPAVLKALSSSTTLAEWPDWFGGAARLLAGTHAGLDLIVLDAPHLYDRPGNPYLDAQGRDWPDNAERFAALALAATRIGWGEVESFVPDVIHAHDWQAALVPAYQRYLGAGKPKPATVLTLHNLAFQGQFPPDVLPRIGLPAEAFASHGVEYFGDVGYLKSGILFADAITTVSPTYAHEILTPAGGMGMDAMLRWRSSDVTGIVNGIDTTVWNPATDPALASPYDAGTLSSRVVNKRAVERRFGLQRSDGLLVCMISRLTTQKGMDLVIDAVDELVEHGTRFVVLGSGDAVLEQGWRDASVRHPGRVGVQIGYDETLSHLMQGGSDAILVPSLFEPCGLTQLYGLRYGCVPIVSRVGGLADTVIDANDAAIKAGAATGLQFADVTRTGIVDVIRRAESLFAESRVWSVVQRNGMWSDVGWRVSAGAYAALYRRVFARRDAEAADAQ
jgi:starch synthase